MDINFSINIWLSIIGLIIGLVGISLTIIQYVKRKTKRLYYKTEGMNITSNLSREIEPLQMCYNKKKINSLTYTRLLFWNEGTVTINRNDIAQADPLYIVARDDVKIYDARIMKNTKESNLFSVELNKMGNKIKLEFDYIDKDDATLIRIIHNGTKNNDIYMEGYVKGFGKPKDHVKSKLNIFVKRLDNISRNFFHIFIAILSSLSVFLFIGAMVALVNGTKYGKFIVIPIALIILTSVLMLIILSPIVNRLPQGFKDFDTFHFGEE